MDQRQFCGAQLRISHDKHMIYVIFVDFVEINVFITYSSDDITSKKCVFFFQIPCRIMKTATSNQEKYLTMPILGVRNGKNEYTMRVDKREVTSMNCFDPIPTNIVTR